MMKKRNIVCVMTLLAVMSLSSCGLKETAQTTQNMTNESNRNGEETAELETEQIENAQEVSDMEYSDTQEVLAEVTLEEDTERGTTSDMESDIEDNLHHFDKEDYTLYAYTTDVVNVRQKATTDSDVLEILPVGAAVKVAVVEQDWAYVITEEGKTGCIYAEYLSECMTAEEWQTYQEEKQKHKLIVIDAGHQSKGNSELEPIGPGASTSKAKVAGGTSGVVSGLPEYELTLQVANKLQAELMNRGYEVIMVRNSNEVNISNSERAMIANNANADAFIRIHADGSENSATNGAHTICQTSNNPYNASLYSQSKKLSQCVISQFVAATGCRAFIGGDGVSERDDLSGINWCQVPTTLIELGFMTNPQEDANMADSSYQEKMVSGIANGIDTYFQ